MHPYILSRAITIQIRHLLEAEPHVGVVSSHRASLIPMVVGPLHTRHDKPLVAHCIFSRQDASELGRSLGERRVVWLCCKHWSRSASCRVPVQHPNTHCATLGGPEETVLSFCELLVKPLFQ